MLTATLSAWADFYMIFPIHRNNFGRVNYLTIAAIPTFKTAVLIYSVQPGFMVVCNRSSAEENCNFIIFQLHQRPYFSASVLPLRDTCKPYLRVLKSITVSRLLQKDPFWWNHNRSKRL